MVEGLFVALSPEVLVYTCIGTLAGIVFGCLPGLTATMGVALLLPFTFILPPEQGLAMLGALYVAAMFADSVPACMVNTPGTPSAMATALDGFELTKQGKSRVALIASSYAAFVGTLMGGFAFLLISGPLAEVALSFGPAEFFWVGVFAVTIIASIAGDSLLKGVAGGAIGMLIGMVGLSETGAVTRFTFDIPELSAGTNRVAALIGIFALPQVLKMVSSRMTEQYIASYTPRRGEAGEALRTLVRRQPLNIMRSGVIGTIIGILPGAGASVANLVSYNEAVRWSRDKSKFGKGDLRGVTASETAGNAAAGGSMIPLMSLGVPGSAPAAVILGALLLQGIRPGPTLFATNETLIYTFAWSIIVSGFTTFAFGTALSRQLVRMISIPVWLLAPLILFLSIMGAFAIRSLMIDVYFMVGLGLFCFLAAKLGFSAGPIGLGLILAPIVEPAFVQALTISEATSVIDVFFGDPVSLLLIVITVVSTAWIVVNKRKERRQLQRVADSPGAVEDGPRSV